MALTLCGCEATLNQSLVEKAPAPLAVDLRALNTCRAFLKPVPLPDLKVGPAGDFADVAIQKEDAAIMTANGRIVAAEHCVGDVQARYAGAGRKEKSP